MDKQLEAVAEEKKDKKMPDKPGKSEKIEHPVALTEDQTRKSYLTEEEEELFNKVCPDLPEEVKFPLLKPGQSARFQSNKLTFRRTVDGAKVPTYPAGFTMPGEITVYDGNGKAYLLQNVVGSKIVRNKKGEQDVENEIERIRMDKSGNVTLTAQENVKYIYMRLHPACEESPMLSKNKNSRKMYRYVQDGKPQKKKIGFTPEEIYEAMDIIKHMSYDELVNLATSIPTDASGNMEVLTGRMLELAQKQPKLIVNASGNRLSLVKMKVQQALDKRIIAFSESMNVYYFTADRATVCEAAANGIPNEYIADSIIDSPEMLLRLDQALKINQ